MGWKLAEEVQRHAPDSLTWRERYAASVLAHAANEKTRELWGVERQEITSRLRMGRTERYNVVAALVSKGVLVRLQRGRHGTRAVYGFLQLTEDPESPDVNASSSVREQQPQRPGTATVASGNDQRRVREPRTPSRHLPSSVDISSRTRRRQRVTADDVIGTITQEIEIATGRTIAPDEARSIRDQIIGGREVSAPAAYCRAAIRNEPDPARKFLPQQLPPPLPRSGAKLADPAHVSELLARIIHGGCSLAVRRRPGRWGDLDFGVGS